MQSKEKLLEECVSYLRARPVFDRVLRQVREKAESLGHIGGKTIISIRSGAERDQLEGFFQKNLHGKKQLTVSVELLERALADSRLCGSFPGMRFYAAYFGGPFIGKKEQREREESDPE